MPLLDQTGNNSNPEKLFEAIGTFYENIPETAKLQLQTFFEALSRLKNGIQFNLYQSDLLQYLKYSDGWLELLYKKYTVFFDNTGSSLDFKNTKNEYLGIPSNISLSGGGSGSEVYAYRVAAYNSEGETIASEEVVATDKGSDLSSPNELTVSWDAVPNATGYKVYGRNIKDHELLKTTASTSYDDNGTAEDASEEPKEANTALYAYLYTLPDDFIYLSIPEFIEGGSATLTEGTDYEIVSTNKIRFFNSSLTKKTDTVKQATYNEYLAKTGIILSPVLSKFYLKAFGKENPKELVLNSKYLPHIKDYSSLTKYEKAQAIGKHFKYFCWASSVYLRRKPTIDSIERTWGISKDYPFAYEAGKVTDRTGQYITVSGQAGIYTYDIEAGNNHVYSLGEDVGQFDLLVSGASLKDYYSDPLVISGLASTTEEPRLIVQLSSAASGFSPDDDIVAKFKKVSIPSGLILKT